MQAEEVPMKFKSAFEAKLASQILEPKGIVKKKYATLDHVKHDKQPRTHVIRSQGSHSSSHRTSEKLEYVKQEKSCNGLVQKDNSVSERVKVAKQNYSKMSSFNEEPKIKCHNSESKDTQKKRKNSNSGRNDSMTSVCSNDTSNTSSTVSSKKWKKPKRNLSRVETISEQKIQVDKRYTVVTLKDDAIALLIKSGSQLALKGSALIRCVYGHASVQGFSLSENSDAYHPLYSPDSHCLVTLNVSSDPPISSTDALATKLNAEFTSPHNACLQVILDSAQHHACVVILKKLSCKVRDFVTQFTPYRTLFVRSDLGVSEEDTRDDGSVVLREVDVEIRREHEPNQFTTSKEYEDVAVEFIQSMRTGSTPVIALCGGKNMGKSTLGRYLVNQSLDSVPAIAYLECDLGQTEFTPPGCVSLHLITDPVLGPPFTHQREAVTMCYMGATHPSDDPRRYIACLQHVYIAYSRLQPRPPLIVNTMGWNKGLGLSLLIDAFRITQPSHIVQIDGEGGQSKNLPEMTPQFLSNPPSCVHDLGVVKNRQTTRQHHLIKIKSPVRNQLGCLSPADHRNVSLLAYLSRALVQQRTPSLSFLDVTPYKIAWKDVAVHICHAHVPRAQILYALNASVVALCIADQNQIVDYGVPDAPKFLKGNPVCDCVGYGVVRSIDEDSRSFFVITPVVPSVLETVNCLIGGAIEIPAQMMMANITRSGRQPYVGQPKDVTGATAIKRRRHMQRRGSSSDKTGLQGGH